MNPDTVNADGKIPQANSGRLNRSYLIAEVKRFKVETLVEVKAMSILPLKTGVKTNMLTFHISGVFLNP